MRSNSGQNGRTQVVCLDPGAASPGACSMLNIWRRPAAYRVFFGKWWRWRRSCRGMGLSATACAGILRRASCRGKTLPWRCWIGRCGSRRVLGICRTEAAYGKATVTFGFGGGNTAGPIDVAACLTAAPGPKNDFEVETFVAQSIAGSINHSSAPPTAARATARTAPARVCRSSPSPPRAAEPMQRWPGQPTLRARAGIAQPRECRRRATIGSRRTRGEARLESGHGQLAGTLSTGGGKPGQGRPMVIGVALRGRTEGLAAELGDGVSTAAHQQRRCR